MCCSYLLLSLPDIIPDMTVWYKCHAVSVQCSFEVCATPFGQQTQKKITLKPGVNKQWANIASFFLVLTSTKVYVSTKISIAKTRRRPQLRINSAALFPFLGKKSRHGNADRELMSMEFSWTISLEQISAARKQDVEIRLETG